MATSASSQNSEDIYAGLACSDRNVYYTMGHTSPNRPTAQHTEKSGHSSHSYRMAAVCLGILCALLLATITALCVYFIMSQKFSPMDRNLEDLKASYISLNKDKNQLQSEFIALTEGKDQIQKDYTSLAKDKDCLQKDYISLAKDKEKLQKDYISLAKDKDHLQKDHISLAKDKEKLQKDYISLAKDKEKLQKDYISLAKDKAMLQRDYNTLAKDMKNLQTNHISLDQNMQNLEKDYISLTKDKDQLEKGYNTLEKGKDELQRDYNSLTNNKNQLQSDYSILATEKDQLQKHYISLAKDKDQLQKDYITLTKDKDQLQQNFNTLLQKCPLLDQCCPLVPQKRVCRSCPPGWEQFNSKCYYFSTIRGSWTDSRNNCCKQGADLVKIESIEEQVFINKHTKEENYWIGLTDSETEGTWLWVDRTPLQKGFWRPGEPNNRNPYCANADCVVTVPAHSPFEQCVWEDKSCSLTMRWVCETEALLS